jgi:hypothetical protein
MKQIAKSDLVRWFEYYEDRIVRDAGLGIIIDVRYRTIMEREWTMCLVYKFKSGHMDWFDSHELSEINPSVPES